MAKKIPATPFKFADNYLYHYLKVCYLRDRTDTWDLDELIDSFDWKCLDECISKGILVKLWGQKVTLSFGVCGSLCNLIIKKCTEQVWYFDALLPRLPKVCKLSSLKLRNYFSFLVDFQLIEVFSDGGGFILASIKRAEKSHDNNPSPVGGGEITLPQRVGSDAFAAPLVSNNKHQVPKTSCGWQKLPKRLANAAELTFRASPRPVASTDAESNWSTLANAVNRFEQNICTCAKTA